MVRLKLLTNMRIVQSKKKSQFHYGSIKTSNLPKLQDLYSESQFHYGSIKTEKAGNS